MVDLDYHLDTDDFFIICRSINIIDSIFTVMLLGALFYFSILFAFYGFLLGTVSISPKEKISFNSVQFFLYNNLITVV